MNKNKIYLIIIMPKVHFIYRGRKITQIKCKDDDEFENICKEFCKQSKININDLVFVYHSEILNLDNQFNDLAINQKKIVILACDKNEFCYEHNKVYIYYCVQCEDYLCNECKKEHNNNNHKIIRIVDASLETDIFKIYKDNIKKLRGEIDKFNEEIINKKYKDDKNNLIEELKMNLEKYYLINNNMLNNFNNNEKINFRIFNNLNNINNINNIIRNNLEDIINEKDTTNKFNIMDNLNYMKIFLEVNLSKIIKII